MKQILKIVLLVLITLTYWSCNKDDSPESTTKTEVTTTKIEVTITNTEEYIYDFNFSGDEEGASIITQAEHYQTSETYRDTVYFSVLYHYIPEPGYTGTEYVKIETCTGGIGTMCSDKALFEIYFTVTQ
jgi:hypothetical protein